MILVSGGAGFIGSNFVRSWFAESNEPLLNVDALTYAGNLANLDEYEDDPRHIFVHANITDQAEMVRLIDGYTPRAIVHFAAESHVDRSIDSPTDFVQTNVFGTFSLLEAARQYWLRLGAESRSRFRFLHVSTDEVYGSLGPSDPPFRETTPYMPNSPYSASKAGSDHLVRAYHHTYSLPTLTTNCSNNYGPFQFPEKLIPLCLLNALADKPLPIYGDGQNVRDWLFVEDHCSAIKVVLRDGSPGETYNIGGWNEMTNLSVVREITNVLDTLRPRSNGASYADLITFVKDRPGHDRRYAIDASKIRNDLNWSPRESFETGIRKTIRWYLDNPQWIENVRSGVYREWISEHYGTNHEA